MQNYILIEPAKRPARLSLGIIGDLPDPWQKNAQNLLFRRRLKLEQRLHAVSTEPDSLAAGSRHSVQKAGLTIHR